MEVGDGDRWTKSGDGGRQMESGCRVVRDTNGDTFKVVL